MRYVASSYLCLFVLAFVFSQPPDIDFIKVPENSRNDSPAITFTEDGTLWLAWCSYQNGQFRLAVCSRKGNHWTSIEYPDPSQTDQLEPQWAMGSAQKPRLVYTVFDGIRWEIFQVKKGEQGWGRPRALGLGTNPTAAFDGNELWTAWEQNKGIVILSLTADKNKKIKTKTFFFKPKGTFTAYSHPQLSSGTHGEAWLCWTASQYGYQSVLLKRIDRGNHSVLVVDSGKGVNRNPRVSVAKEGRVWIVYEALECNLDLSRRTMREKNKSVYLLDQGYIMENPSRVVKVTNGKNWWKPEEPADPARGFMPNILCSRKGTVWLLSRSIKGFSRPFKNFFPLCESLGPDGWRNHGEAWLKQHNYKALMPIAESPEGEVWTAWAQHFRKKKAYNKTPSWTLLDAPDTIAVASMPKDAKLGNPKLIPLLKKTIPAPDPVVFARYQTEYVGEEFRVYFGDLHQHSEFSTCGLWNGRIDQNQHYSRDVRGLDFMCTIDHAEHLNDHNWKVTQLVAEKYNQPHEFVTFAGFEWTSEFDGGGNLYRGHYNAVFRDVGNGDYYFSASDPHYNTPLKLWEALRKTACGKENVFTFPHHTSRRVAWLSWNYYDPEMVPLIEIAQSRGSYEYEGCFSDQTLSNDCSRVRGHFIHDGLARGMRWGFIASGDHGGRQLAAVFSPTLKRDDIFNNLRARRAYATNGERMFLDVRVNGHFMGEEFILKGEKREIVFKVIGTTPLVQVDLFRNGRIIRQWNMQSLEYEEKWVDRDPLYRRENYYYLRAIQKNGGQAWSSPIWVINPNIPGKFSFQVGGDELRIIYPEEETDIAILMHNETEVAVKGKVFLEVPSGWMVKEKNGIDIDCSAGAWCHAVFQVTAPVSAFTSLCLPSVSSHFVFSNKETLESSLFVVGSPTPISRSQKAVLIDARTEIPRERFADYLEKMARVWGKEF